MNAENTRVILYGFLDGCPFTYDDNCPIKEQRKMPEEQRRSWARNLSLEEINKIVEQHEKCFWQRMGLDKT